MTDEEFAKRTTTATLWYGIGLGFVAFITPIYGALTM